MSRALSLEGYFSHGRFAVVGCARGLGKTLATRMAEMGAEVLLFDIDAGAELLASKLREQGLKARYAQVVVRNSESLGNGLQGEMLDGLVYLVRGGNKEAYLSVAPDAWHKNYSLTVKGAFFNARAALPSLKSSATGLPSILFVSSVLAHMGGWESIAYHTAKAALEQLMRYLAVQVGPFGIGIRVNAV